MEAEKPVTFMVCFDEPLGRVGTTQIERRFRDGFSLENARTQERLTLRRWGDAEPNGWRQFRQPNWFLRRFPMVCEGKL